MLVIKCLDKNNNIKSTMFSYLVLCLALTAVAASSTFQWKQHNNEELPLVLEEVHQKCPSITRVYTLSEPSVRGVPLYVIEFSETPGFHQPCK